MNPQTLMQLLTVMDEQIKVMSDLAALSQKKSQVLVDGNIEQLDVLLRGEQAVLWQMSRLEERRFQLQVQLAEQMRIEPTQLTLELLLQRIPPEYTQPCQRVAQEYGRLTNDLAQANQTNAELVQQALAYVDFSLQAHGATGPASGKVYSPGGPRQSGTDNRARRLDNRV